MADYKIQEVSIAPQPAGDIIPGITVPKIDYGTSVGGKDAPADGATNNSAEIVNGVLISDVANTQFDTSTKQILGDFTFGASGALKMITDANNGLWISPTGILGKKSGVTTLAVDTGGNASFRGSVVITGGSGIASLSDAGDLATLDSIGASNCDTTIISGGKIITGLLTASNITTGTLTGILIQTSTSSYEGVKMSSSIGGIALYGQNFSLYDTSGTVYGYIGGYGGYFRMETYGSRNMLLGASGGSVILYSDTVPLYTNSANLGNSSYRWGNVYTSNIDINGGSYYINYNSSKSAINSNSNFRVAGSVYITGNLIFENAASITINGRAYYETTGAYDSSKYYLRS